MFRYGVTTYRQCKKVRDWRGLVKGGLINYRLYIVDTSDKHRLAFSAFSGPGFGRMLYRCGLRFVGVRLRVDALAPHKVKRGASPLSLHWYQPHLTCN